MLKKKERKREGVRERERERERVKGTKYSERKTARKKEIERK